MLFSAGATPRARWLSRPPPAFSLEGLPMADQWYYARGEVKLGQFAASQLKDLAAGGRILLADTVWKAGIEGGVSAAKVKNLFPLAPAQSAPADPTLSPSLPPTEAQGRAAVGDPRAETPAEELPPSVTAPPSI